MENGHLATGFLNTSKKFVSSLISISDREIRRAILQFLQLRIGEASNPGPDDVQHGLLLGCFNPTGILHKGNLLQYLPSGSQALWGVSESHLTGLGIKAFKKELAFHNTNFSLVTGAPVPYRSNSIQAIGGKQLGVAILSNMPTRSLQPSWDAETWQGARFHMTTSYCQGRWIHGATFYGPAFRADTMEVRSQTDQLLQNMTNRIVMGMSGLRYIMGDFNQTDGQLLQPELWKKLGWKEVQNLGKELFNQEPKPTCKSKSIKDFLWISPELAEHFESVSTIDDLFPDHAVLYARFKPWAHPEPIPFWRKPKPISWDKLPKTLPKSLDTPVQTNPDDEIARIATAFEERVNSAHINTTGVCLNSAHKGRSKTSSTVNKRVYTKTTTKSREGDITPTFFGISLQHTRWFRQLRRLESYKRMTDQDRTLQQKIQQDRVWRSILKSTGFPFGFRKWWCLTVAPYAGAPTEIPVTPPSQGTATIIYDIFEVQVKLLEQQLLQNLTQKAVQNRINNPNKIFEDIRKPCTNPVQTLAEVQEDTVVMIDESNCTVSFEHPARFVKHLPLIHDNGACKIVNMDDNMVQVDSLENISVGTQLKQETFEASLTTLFQKFGEEWTKRWDKHFHIEDSRWDPLTEFFTRAVQKVPEMEYHPINIQQWKDAIKKKKAKSAVGPDGWSKWDLLRLPDDLTQQLLDLISRVEDTNSKHNWPTSIITGLVHSLEKVPGASRTSQFRPITVFSLIYRTWSSIRSKQCLQHLIDHVPTHCYGNMPGRQASQVWYGIQQKIEEHAYSGLSLSGAMVDIIKCFNTLPRTPLMSICVHLGLPKMVVNAWGKALVRMQRRFVIRGATGPPLRSTTGFAEGCGMSVVAMVAANVLTATWLSQKIPSIQLWSYVDNLEILSPSAEETSLALSHLDDFTQLMDIEIDTKKTIVWSNKSTGRKILRSQNFEVKHWMRDLGGHVQYSQLPTNSVIVQRIMDFKPRWKDLARSKASYAQKLRAIRSVAWPTAMHGISSIHLGEDHLDELRTGAMRGTEQHGLGTSPKIHLSLIEPVLTDPGYYAIWRTLCDFREQTSLESSQAILDNLVFPTIRIKPSPGPCSVVLHRLNSIHWSWSKTRVSFYDQNGLDIDIWEAPIQELQIRSGIAWQQKIAGEMAHRKTFKGLGNTNSTLTKNNWPCNPMDAAILRRCLNGTFVTSDRRKYHADENSTLCPFCSQEDSQRHRHWECHELESARVECPPEVRRNILNSDPCLINHGWINNPIHLEPFQQQLLQLPDKTNLFDHYAAQEDYLELFTDGSCRDPTEPLTRLCAWGVTASTPKDPHFDYYPVSSGVLAGFVQTISRAELTAFLSASRFALSLAKPFRIWTDSQYVVKQVNKLCRRLCRRPPRNKPNHDLLDKIRVCLIESNNLFLGIGKVSSHQNKNLLDPIEAWICGGNDAADSLAQFAFTDQPRLIDTWEKLKLEVSNLKNFQKWAHHTFIRVGHLAMDKQKELQKRDDPDRGDEFRGQLPYVRWSFPETLPATLKSYDIPEWMDIYRWTESLHEEGETMYLSWYQLFADFVLSYPDRGPYYKASSKKWKGGKDRPETHFAQRQGGWQPISQGCQSSWNSICRRSIADRSLSQWLSGQLVFRSP